MSQTKKSLILEALADGLPKQQAVQWGGTSYTTFWRWMKDDPEFAGNVERAEIECLQRCVQRISTHASWQSAAWFLERRLPGEFALTQTIAKVLREQYGLIPIPDLPACPSDRDAQPAKEAAADKSSNR